MKPKVALLLLIGAALLIYQPAWHGGFLWTMRDMSRARS